MKLPEITSKKMDDILKDIRGKAPFYTPEWTSDNKDDVGMALSTIFAYFSEIAAKRLNQAPTRHFLGFLDAIGSSLLSAQPARVPLKFVLSEGASENVLIPASTEASAADMDGKPIPFQTENDFVAAPSKLVSVFSVNAKEDKIYDHQTAIDGVSTIDLFSGQNLQEHSFYIGDSNLFNIHRRAIIRFHIKPSDKVLLVKLKNNISWAYGVEVIRKKDGQETKEMAWKPLVSDLDENLQLLTLIKKEDGDIDEMAFHGLKSRWIKGTVTKDNIENVKDIKITQFSVSVIPEPTQGIPVKKVQGIGEIFYEALINTGIETIEELRKLSSEELDRYIHCGIIRAENILEAAKKAYYDKTGKIPTVEVEGIHPDFTFYNDVPLDVEKGEIFPFGKKPQKQDAFYIASQDAFSKKGYTVIMAFDLFPGKPSNQSIGIPNTPQLSWEYWDGEAWVRLDVAPGGNWTTDKPCDNTGKPPLVQTELTIASMPEVKKTKVNGKENYWIRVRIVDGDYGKEFILKGREIEPGQYCPPCIKDLGIVYSKDVGDTPEYRLTRNNLQFEEAKETIVPFEALPDVFPSIYFGFDKTMKGGPFSLFVSIDERYEYPGESYPRLKWEYASTKDGGSWIEFEGLDETRGFTGSGMIQFVIADDMKAEKLFGEMVDRYWMRAFFTENYFNNGQTPAPAVKGIPIVDKRGWDYLSDILHRKRIEIPNINLAASNLRKAFPKVNGFFANSTWAFQSRTVKDEVVGSSNGEAVQSFYLMNTPVINVAVWINEVKILSEGERKILSENGSHVEDRKDDRGNIIEFWVQWKEQSDFLNSGEGDRHYIVDRTAGVLLFGDGERGMIPPAGLNNIKATYATGGGVAGNVSAYSIIKLQSAIPFVDKVFNPLPADGGADTENADELIRRAPSVLKHRRRATALEDYEWLVHRASRKVARVKVLPNFNGKGLFETGWVTIVIVPRVSDAKPTPSPELKRLVETYLKKSCPNVASIRVIQPSYIRIDVQSAIITNDIDAIPSIENAAKKRIREFLHPLNGGPEGQGWLFGSVPCASDIYAIFEEIDHVDHVGNVILTLQTDDSQTIIMTNVPDAFKPSEYVLPYSGEHTISVKWEEKGEN